jgi:hypothetical protein
LDKYGRIENMSERSRKLIDSLKESMAYAIDTTLDDDFTTGYSLCEDSSGNIQWDKYVATELGSDLHLKCYSPYMKPKAAIIIIPKKEF